MSASEDYLRKEENLGDAILHLYVQPSGKHFVIEIYDEYIDNNGYKNYRAPRSISAARFVERRFHHGYKVAPKQGVHYPRYEVPITDYTIHLIHNAWVGNKVISDAAKPYFRNIFLREFAAEANAKRTAEFKFKGIVPTSPWHDAHDKALAEKGITFNPYQKVASYNCTQSKAYAYFCDPGLGKTAMMIRKLDYVIDHAPKERKSMSVVFCPKTIRTNWINEIEKFSTNTDKIKIVILQGTNPTNRIINLLTDISSAMDKHIVIIAGFDAWVSSPNIWQTKDNGGFGFEFDLALFDESQNIANFGTKRTKTFLEMRNIFANRVIATGTPFRNTPFDIFPQFEFLGEGYSGFDSFSAFKQFYGQYSMGYNGKVTLTSYQNIPLMQEKIARHAFVIKKEEALPHLPKKTFGIKECEMAKEQEKVYYSLAEELIAEINSYGDDVDSITVNNILTQMLRLAQITSGYAAMDSGLINKFDPNPKLDLLVHHLLGDPDEETDGTLTDPNSKTIVWCAFKENLRMIRARLELEGIKSVLFHGGLDDAQRNTAVQAFNCDPETRVFIGIQASGGVGLNLVGFDPYNPDKYKTNCDNVVNYSSNWSWVNRAQAMDRAHRHITRVPVHITDLIATDSEGRETIDKDIYKRLMLKEQLSVTIQDIRNILMTRLSVR